MPTYDYQCKSNGEVVELTHRMSEEISNWGELCERKGIDPGKTAADAPVVRMATGGQFVSSVGSGQTPACASGGCCPGGGCNLG